MDRRILLIFPPFTSRKNPYLSIPVLAKYLKRKNIPVTCEDIGLLFWNNFISNDNFKKGMEYIENKFFCLNEKNRLSFKETVEFVKLNRILNALSAFKNRSIKSLPDNLLINILTAPWFPDIYMEKPVNKFFSSFDEFSSIDIINSVEHNFFYSSVIEDIIIKILKGDKKPGVVGISLIFSNQVFPAFYCASLIKKYSPDTHITMGGPYVTLHFNKIENIDIFNLIDSFILDEGEIPLEKLFYEVQREIPDFSNIPNMIWFDGKKIVINRHAPPLELRKLTCPDYGIMPLDSYQCKRDEMIFPFRLSKGCYWQKCSFCRTGASFCKNYDQPDYSSVFTALLEAREKYNIKNFMFSDESAHPALLEYLSEKIIKNKLDISWFTHTRFHRSLTKKKFELFKRANCTFLTLGLESYNDRLLNLMHKGINIKLINEVLENNNGILPLKAYMILGFPTETQAEAVFGYNTLENFIKGKKLTGCSYSFFSLTYGSDMWKNPGNYGIYKINLRKNQDLLPDVIDLECKGMSRQKVNELYLSFSETFTTAPFLNELIINDKRVKINHDINLLSEMIKKNSFQSNIMPFTQWLDTVDIKA